MNLDLIDILACPTDGGPLRVAAGEEQRGALANGFLRCRDCGAPYAIRNSVPHLVRPGMRRPDREREAFESLSNPPAGLKTDLERIWERAKSEQTDDDRQRIAEGDYWERYFELYWNLNSRTIFDARRADEHIPYLGYGIMAVDDRDRWRAHDHWPDPLGRRIVRFFDETCENGARTWLDLGCAAGQWGLEAAWRGSRVVGFDVAVGVLELAARYAAEQSLDANYIYAEASAIPFQSDAFDAFVVKDSLHHLPDPRAALKSVARVCRDQAPVMLIEHVADKPRWEWLKQKILESAIGHIEQRYGRDPDPPPVFVELSPCEDSCSDILEEALREAIEIEEIRREILFADEWTLPIYFATGKRRFPAEMMSRMLYAFERFAQTWSQHRFVWLRGRLEKCNY